MAFRVNRPFRIGKYARLRLNKESLGLTLGGKYARGTLNTKGDLTGSVGGAFTSDLDAMTVNFLSERCLVTQAANNFVLFKGV